MNMQVLAIAVLAVSLMLPLTSNARQVKVRGYFKQNGTYVAPHIRTSPDRSIWNNYSTKGNFNPYSGQQGTVNPYRMPRLRPYGNLNTNGFESLPYRY